MSVIFKVPFQSRAKPHSPAQKAVLHEFSTPVSVILPVGTCHPPGAPCWLPSCPGVPACASVPPAHPRAPCAQQHSEVLLTHANNQFDNKGKKEGEF